MNHTAYRGNFVDLMILAVCHLGQKDMVVIVHPFMKQVVTVWRCMQEIYIPPSRDLTCLLKVTYFQWLEQFPLNISDKLKLLLQFKVHEETCVRCRMVT
jgi:hypothetical protein